MSFTITTGALVASVHELVPYIGYLLAALFAWQAINPITRWRYRHIPGPFGWPFVGNIVPIVKHQFHIYLQMMSKQYGPIFKVWFGGSPWVVVSDADAMRKVCYKLNTHMGVPNTLLGEERFVLDNVLVFNKGETWRLLKKAWDPAIMHGASLEGYAPLMQECADGLLERLEGRALEGAAVNIWTELQRMTLDVVGSCAFGIKFYNSGASQTISWGGDSEELRADCSNFFRTTMGEQGSAWLLPIMMLPPLAPLLRRLAYLLPDKGHKLIVRCMQGMTSAARTIIGVSSAQRKWFEAASKDSTFSWEQDAQSGEGAAASIVDGEGKQQRGVLPGSFVAQLEAWRAKHDPEGQLSDNLIASQVITFLLAGYETTANALAFLVYRLSIHPEVQQKVQEELEAVLGGRKPTLEDLPKLKYLDACTKEALRLHPVVPLITRVYDNEPTHPATLELCGKSIPRGAVVVPLTVATGNSSAYWERPEEFLPERFLPETGGRMGPFHEYAFMPFGSGGRKCTGYKFAEQEMLLVGAALLRRFSVTRPAGEGVLLETLGLALAPTDGVKVLLRARAT